MVAGWRENIELTLAAECGRAEIWVRRGGSGEKSEDGMYGDEADPVIEDIPPTWKSESYHFAR